MIPDGMRNSKTFVSIPATIHWTGRWRAVRAADNRFYLRHHTGGLAVMRFLKASVHLSTIGLTQPVNNKPLERLCHVLFTPQLSYCSAEQTDTNPSSGRPFKIWSVVKTNAYGLGIDNAKAAAERRLRPF
jgi:hypothetical protein